jgi:hypothetical protein
MNMNEDDLARRAAVRLFTGAEPEPAPQSNVVKNEGANPPVAPSEEGYAKDFARRLFSDADTIDPPLN